MQIWKARRHEEQSRYVVHYFFARSDMEISILVGRKNKASGIPWPAGHTGMHSYRFFLIFGIEYLRSRKVHFSKMQIDEILVYTSLHNSNGFKWFSETNTLWQKGLTPIWKAQQLRSYTLRTMANFDKFCQKLMIIPQLVNYD